MKAELRIGGEEGEVGEGPPERLSALGLGLGLGLSADIPEIPTAESLGDAFVARAVAVSVAVRSVPEALLTEVRGRVRVRVEALLMEVRGGDGGWGKG